ncbi:MAG: hypothetical protein M0042_14885 [Nitrospiraceae bacterium]|nr:hypothetical protein [Nitrospiraceae bacterium]
MNARIKYAVQVVVFLLYSVYAVSPIYASAFVGRSDLTAGGSGVTVGIVWVNALLASLVDHDRPERPAIESGDPDDRDGEFILIKKKRAVLPDSLRIEPLFGATVRADGLNMQGLPPRAREISLHLFSPYDDQALSRHLGLSPPLFL